MAEYYSAPMEIHRVPDIMGHIQEIEISEENKYSDIPQWSGKIEQWTEAAVLLHFPVGHPRPKRLNWFPYSQLRKTEDGLTVYASLWILDKKGF